MWVRTGELLLTNCMMQTHESRIECCQMGHTACSVCKYVDMLLIQADRGIRSKHRY